MTESNATPGKRPGRPVSMRKGAAADGAGSSAHGFLGRLGGGTLRTPDGEEVTRPQTVVAAVVALLLSGVFAVVAALSLYGAHDYLTTSFNKQVIPTSEITATVNAAADKYDPTASGHASGKVSDAVKNKLDDVRKDHSGTSTDDVKKQASNASDAAKNSSDVNAFRSTFQQDLQKLQKTEQKNAKDSVGKVPSQQLISGVVLLLICALIAVNLARGRYWSRWAVLAVWALSSFTGTTVAGISSLFAVSTSLPGGFKAFIALCGLSMLICVILVMLPKSSRFFAALRPTPVARGAGGMQRRGLFAPRVPPPAANRNATKTPATTRPANDDPDRARSKKRSSANAQAVAKGADLARTRAKAASKSRRSGDS